MLYVVHIILVVCERVYLSRRVLSIFLPKLCLFSYKLSRYAVKYARYSVS